MNDIIIGVNFPDNINDFITRSKMYAEEEVMKILSKAQSLQRIGCDVTFLRECGTHITDVFRKVNLSDIPVLDEKHSAWSGTKLPETWTHFMLIEKLTNGEFCFTMFENKAIQKTQNRSSLPNRSLKYSVCCV